MKMLYRNISNNRYLYFLVPIVLILICLNIGQAQSHDHLRQQAKEVIQLVKKGEDYQDPRLIIDAIKILLKMDGIRKMQIAEEGPSLEFREVNYFNLTLLYNKAWKMIPEYDKKTQKRLDKLNPKIKEKLAYYKEMAVKKVDILEVIVYTVQPEGIIPLVFSFDSGNTIEFYIEIGKNFIVEIWNNGKKIKSKYKKIDDQGYYTFTAGDAGNYELRVSNILSEAVLCTIFKHVK